MREHQIKDKYGIVIGRFKDERDRDNAFKEHIKFGFKSSDEVLP